MKKILVISVLALFLALPTFAVSNWDFTANADVTITGMTINSSTADLIIKSGSKARSITFNANGTLAITNAATSTFQIYSTSSEVKAIKIASTTGATTSCTVNDTTGAVPATIASTTEASDIFTVSLITLANTLTYNNYCGAATCVNGYEVSGSGASATCSACTVLTGVATYNDTVCGAATCDTGYTLSGSGASAICVPPPGIVTGGTSGGSTYTPTPATPATPATPGQTPATPATPAEAADQIKNIVAEAATMAGHSVGQILAAVGAMQNSKAEDAAEIKYTNSLVAGLKNISAEVKDAITNFVNYGTPTTKILGAGERAGVINSYKAAFGKVPMTSEEWSDVIKIGNGRWPTARNTTSEANAAIEFKKIYNRTANMQQANDNAAVTVIAYGLRPGNRNLSSEKAAIKSFKAIYGHAPVSAVAWDIVRAIAYSGAKR
jgi:hypothetical protein